MSAWTEKTKNWTPQQWAEWAVEGAAACSQDVILLSGEEGANEYLIECLELNLAKAIEHALAAKAKK